MPSIRWGKKAALGDFACLESMVISVECEQPAGRKNEPCGAMKGSIGIIKPFFVLQVMFNRKKIFELGTPNLKLD